MMLAPFTQTDLRRGTEMEASIERVEFANLDVTIPSSIA